MTTRQRTRLVREGIYVAVVEVETVLGDYGWSTWLSFEDACKLDEVRVAPRQSDLNAATKLARVYSLTPVSA